MSSKSRTVPATAGPRLSPRGASSPRLTAAPYSLAKMIPARRQTAQIRRFIQKRLETSKARCVHSWRVFLFGDGRFCRLLISKTRLGLRRAGLWGLCSAKSGTRMDSKSQKFRENAEECRRLAQDSSLPNDWLSVAVEWENMAKLADSLLVMEALAKSTAWQVKKPKAKIIQFPSKRPA
jgi:hypothetical protein